MRDKMVSGVPFSIQMNTDDAEKWAGRIEYVPDLILSSIENKLKSNQNPDDIKNFKTLNNWFENYFRFLNYAITDLKDPKKGGHMIPENQPPVYSQLYNTLHNVQFKAAEIKKSYPLLYAHLDKKFKFANSISLTEDLFAKSDKTQIKTITYATGQKREDAIAKANNYSKNSTDFIASLKKEDKTPVFAKVNEPLTPPSLNPQSQIQEVREGPSVANISPEPISFIAKNEDVPLANNCISQVGKYSGKDAVFKGTITGRIVDIIATYYGLGTFEGKTPMQKKAAYNRLLIYLSNNPETREVLNKALKNYKVYTTAKKTDEGIILDEKDLGDPKQLQANYYVYLPPQILDDKNLASAMQSYDEQNLFANADDNKKRITMR